VTIEYVGSRGTANTKTTGTSLAVTVATANIPAGALVVVRGVTDNVQASSGATTNHTVTDSQSNTYTRLTEGTYSAGGAADGVTASLFYSVLTTGLAAGTDTLTLGSADVPARAVAVEEFSFTGTLNYNADANGWVGTSASPTVTLTGLAEGQYLLFAELGFENTVDTTYTQASGFTNYGNVKFGTSGGGDASNVASGGGYRLAKNVTGGSFNPTLGASSDGVALIAAIYETHAPANVTAVTNELATVTTLRTDGYGGEQGTNQMHERWQFVASQAIGATEYQAVTYRSYNSDAYGNGFVVVGHREIGEAWSWYQYDGTGGLPHLGYVTDNRHNMVALGLDEDGYLHLVYNAGYNNLAYRKSTAPLSTWTGGLTDALSMLGTNESVVVYPTFFNDPSGKLYFIHREGVAGQSDSFVYEYDATAEEWNALTGTTAGEFFHGSDTSPLASVYHGVPVFDPDFGSGGRMYMVFRLHNISDHRWNIGVLCWDGTNWETVDGAAFTMPATINNYPLEVATPTTAEMDYFREIALDSQGRPHVVYTLIAANSQQQLHYAYYDGVFWNVVPLTNQTAADPMSSAHIVIDVRDDTVLILYGHAALGDQFNMLRSVPGDFHTFDRFAFVLDCGYTNPSYDDYQWYTHRRLTMAMAEWLPNGGPWGIWLLEGEWVAPLAEAGLTLTAVQVGAEIHLEWSG
jgi:hypothetical protein